MSGLSLAAYGKINLSLDVLDLRFDGYHQLETVMQSIKLADRLTFRVNNSGSICFGCSDPELINNDNLVVKGAKLLQERFSVTRGADIFLEKKLPVAAGLGGGSSDAAVTLKALNYLWGLDLSMSALISLGARLGADIPFCLVGGTVLARGIGDQLTVLPPAPKIWLVLVKPTRGLGAGEVYKKWDSLNAESYHYSFGVQEALEKNDARLLIRRAGNDLEQAVKVLLPEVEEIKKELLEGGAQKAMVSGSGPTVLGFVDGEEEGIILANRMRKKYEEVYLTHTI